MKGNQSKTTDFAELKQGFRTTYGHFLSKGKWDEQAVSQQQQKESFQKTVELALAKHAPVYLSIDDTVIGAMKTNRILYPDGRRLSAKDYAAILPNGQYHLVTVVRCSSSL